MKILHCDWEAFLGFAESWEGLAPSARRFLLASKPKEVLPQGAVRDLPALLAGGFLRALSDGARVQLSESFHESHKVLRALARHALLARTDGRTGGSKDEPTLRAYLLDHFTNEEREGIDLRPHWHRAGRLVELVTSAGHVRGFLAAEDRRAWEKERLPTRGWSSERAWTQAEPLLDAEHAGADLARLLETLVAEQGPIPFRALAQRLAPLPRTRLVRAIEAGLRYLLCFAALDADLAPVLLLWPGVAARLRRAPAPPPAAVEPVDSLCLAYRVEDLVQLLVRAAEPMRVKADGWSLFSSVERELERGLVPLPAWLSHPRLFPETAPGLRIREALRLAQELGFVAEKGRHGKDLGLVTAPAGWQWLDLDPRARLEKVLELFRPEPERAPAGRAKAGGERAAHPDEVLSDEQSEVLDELEELLADEDENELVPFASRSAHRSTRLSDEVLFRADWSQGLARAAIAAFARLEPGRAVPFRDFLEHAQGSNPFLAPEVARSLSIHREPLTEEQLDELWLHGLQKIFHLYLLPFGGARAGLTPAGALTIELTGVGRYVLGLADDFALDGAAPARTPVRVQPDFEVVFVAPSPALEAAISRFAERRGTGVGVLFRITRASILLAAQARLSADEVLATLAGAATTPVPANVEHEIRAWFASCRQVRIESAHLVRCPDAATAARVLAAGAGKLEALSETVLALTDPAHEAAVTRACRKAGLFLTSEGRESARQRSGARWER